MGGKLGADLWVPVGIGAGFAAALVALLMSLVPWWVVVGAAVAFAGITLVAWLQKTSSRDGDPFFASGPKPRIDFVLLVLPTVVSVRQSNTATIAALAVLGLVAVIRHAGGKSQHATYLPAALLLVCVALTFRSASFSIAVLFLLTAFILFISAGSVPRKVAYDSLVAGLSLHLVANVVGWQLGIQSPAASVRIGGYGTEGGLFGDTRIFFPFTRSINEGAYVAAMVIVAVVAMLKLRQSPRWYHWLGLMAGTVVLLGSNSRTPMLLVVLVAAGLMLTPRLVRGAAPYVVGGALIFPFLLGWLQSVVYSIAEVLAEIPYLARGQSVQEIAGLGTRGQIWTESIRFWDNHVDSLTNQWIGFGYNGHATSGASAYYASGIGDFLTTRTALTMHNSILQELFNSGIIGAAILFGVTILAVYRYGRDPKNLTIFSVVVILALSGIAEIGLSPGLSQTPVFLLLYLAAFMPPKAVKEAPRRRSGLMSKKTPAAPLSR